MPSLQKLLGKDDRMLELIERSAEEAQRSVQALQDFLQQPGGPNALDALAAARRKEKLIYSEIRDLLCTEFISLLEPTDVEELVNSIYKIPKTVEKVAERISLAPHHLQGVELSGLVSLLQQAADTLLAMVRGLRAGPGRARLTELNERLQTIEGDADKGLLAPLRALYTAREDPGRVMFLKDVFELLERVADRCRDAGNVLVRIALKGT